MFQEIPTWSSPKGTGFDRVEQDFLTACESVSVRIPLPIATIDFEASCLPCVGSYPIEVGVTLIETGESHSWIIRPTELWLRRGTWDDAAEALHGLSQEQILAEGLPVEQVRSELSAAVAGHFVASDAAISDGYWLDILFHGVADFSVASVSEALLVRNAPSTNLTQARVEFAKLVAAARFPDRHRARSDSRRVAEAMRILLGHCDETDPVSLVA